MLYSSSSSSSYSSSSSSYSSSAASSAAASSSPSGVSGSPAFLPGRTPNHFGSFLAGRFENSANFSFHIPSSHSARITSAPPSYSFLRSPYVLVSVLRSYLENMWMVGGVLLGEGLGVKTLLDGLVPKLQLLPLGQLLELVILVELSLLVVILVSLQGDNSAPDLVGFVLQLIRV